MKVPLILVDGMRPDLLEDMTIPLFAMGPDFTPGQQLENVSIMDIAPTIASLLDVDPAEEWEGKCLR